MWTIAGNSRILFGTSCGMAVTLCMLAAPFAARADADHFASGKRLYQDNKLPQALSEFKQALQAKPNDSNILYWIGFIDLKMNRPADAVGPLEQAAQLNPGSYPIHLNLGNAYDGVDRVPDAIQQFRAASKLEPANSVPYYNLGIAYQRSGRSAESLAEYRKAADLAPTDPLMIAGLGTGLQNTHDDAGAIVEYRRALKIQPANADIWLNLALAASGEMVSLPDASPRRSELCAMAIDAMNHAEAIRPNDYTIQEAFGERLAECGQFNDAIPHFSRAADLDPGQFNPLLNMGASRARLKQWGLAANAYRKALALQPENSDALHGLGLAQIELGQYDEATRTFRQVTDANPNDLTGWIDLASCRLHAGDTPGGLKALQEAEKHGDGSPRMSQVYRALGSVYAARSDSDSLKLAQSQFEHANELAPHDAETLDGLGLVAQKQNRTEDAIAFVKQAIQANPRLADAYNNLGVAYESQGKIELAKANYRKALEINPNHILARRNLVRYTSAAGSGSR